MTTSLHWLRRGCAQVWKWRAFILASVHRELRSRYTRSLFGWAWLLLPPLVLIAIYTLVFSRLMRGAGLPDHGPYTYSVFLCAGMFTWQWFSELVSRLVGLFTHHASLIKKTTVPWPVLLAVDVLTISFGLCIQLVLFTLLLLAVGMWPGWPALWFVPLLAVQGLLAVGLALGLSVLHVFFRDVGMAVSLVLQIWFWMTPIVYPLEALPAQFQQLLRWNLVTPLTEAYQTVVLQTRPAIDWSSVGLAACAGLLLLLLSVRLVRRNEAQIRDEL